LQLSLKLVLIVRRDAFLDGKDLYRFWDISAFRLGRRNTHEKPVLAQAVTAFRYATRFRVRETRGLRDGRADC
jgi:hypothetical protein